MKAALEQRGAYVMPSGAICARHGLSDAFRKDLYEWLPSEEGIRWRAEKMIEQRRARTDIVGRLTRRLSAPTASFDQVHLDSLMRALAVDGAAPELHKAMEAEVARLMKKLEFEWAEEAA
jgi:hypothetical protein